MTLRARFRLVLVVALGGVIVAGITEAARSANTRADLDKAVREARELNASFRSYYERNGGYPATHSGAGFDRETLDPLRRRGFYRGHFRSTLVGARVDGYESPDDRGLNQEFWLEMTLARDPGVRLLIASSDDAPLAGGEWMDGIFLYRDGELSPI